MGQQHGGLVIEVKVIPDLWLWGWEIHDAADGSLVEASWANAWTAFATPAEAADAGARRGAALARAGAPADLALGVPHS